MRLLRLVGLRAADLPPLEAELGPGLVALVGSPADADEVRRSLVWAVTVGEGGVVLDGPREGHPGIEALWGGTGGAEAAIEAAVGWVAGAALARVEAARAALGAARGAPAWDAPDSAQGGGLDGERRRLLEDATAELRGRENELRALRAEWVEVTGDVEQATMEWLRERQDAETHLQAYRDRARELKARLAQIQTAGPEAPCPTCGRPLSDHLKDVRVQLREEWEGVVQDGVWWKRRREQLEGKPEPLRTLEGRALRAHAAVDGAAERIEGVRARVRELDALRAPPPPGAEADASPEARALERLATALRARARALVLREASRIAERVTAGRVSWVRDAENGPVAEGVFPGGAPAARDREAVELACRGAAALLARAHGAPLGGIVAAPALDALDAEDRLRAVDHLAEVADRLGQVVLVTGTDVVAMRPEAFAGAVELRAGVRGPLRALPVGVARVALAG